MDNLVEGTPSNFAIRISLPYSQLTQVFVAWKQYSSHTIVAYEHPDDAAERVHTHWLILDCKVSSARLKQVAKAHIVSNLEGNALWSFKSCSNLRAEIYKYIVYCTKGKYEPQNVYTIDSDFFKWISNAPSMWSNTKSTETISKSYEAYLEWEKKFKALLQLAGTTADKVMLQRHATAHIMQKHGWLSQHANNLISGYVRTYCLKNNIT